MKKIIIGLIIISVLVSFTIAKDVEPIIMSISWVMENRSFEKAMYVDELIQTANGTWINQSVLTYVTEYMLVNTHRQNVTILDYSFVSDDYGFRCSETVCDDMYYDGNGDGICQAGESCCEIENNKFKCKGYTGSKLKIKFDEAIYSIKEKIKVE